MHICVCIYVCAFFCGECCMHFRTGVLSTSACATVCLIQMLLQHQCTHLWHIRCRLLAHMCVCIYMCICMHMYMDAYVRLWYCLTCWGVVTENFCLCIDVRVHVCVYVCMYACICACAYICICIYVCMCICMHKHVYAQNGGKMVKCETYFGASIPWLAAWPGHELSG